MEYTISFVDDKTADWKIATLEIVEGEGSVMHKDVSINRTNKKGEVFPNFDNIKVGERVRGNLWTTPDGSKTYLFAPKPTGEANRGTGGGFKAGMQKLVEQKQEGIKVAQENKGQSIKIASTIRMAVDIVVAELAGEKIIDESIIKGKIKEWRAWLFEVWSEPEDNPIYPN